MPGRTEPDDRQRLRNDLAAIALLALALLVAFWPALSADYFLNDDFRLVSSTGRPCSELVYSDWNRVLGRPLSTLVQCAALRFVPTLHDFAYARLFEGAWIVVFGWGVFAVCRLRGFRPSAAWLMALGIATLPGMLYLSTLVSGTPVVVALALGAWASVSLAGAENPTCAPALRGSLGVLGTLLALASIFTYQQATMIIVALLAIPLLQGTSLRSTVRTVAIQGTAITLVSAAYVAWYVGSGSLGELSSHPYGTRPEPLSRLSWLVQDALPTAGTLWLPVLPRLAGATAWLVVAGALLGAPSRGNTHGTASDRISRGVVVVLFPAVCLGPVLVSEAPLLYRTLVPASALLVFMASEACSRWLSSWTTGPSVLPRIAAVGLGILLVLSSALTVGNAAVDGAAAELAYVSGAISQQIREGRCSSRVHFVLSAERDDRAAGWKRTDEFFRLATDFPGFHTDIARVVYARLGQRGPGAVTASVETGSPQGSACTVVVDMRPFRRALAQEPDRASVVPPAPNGVAPR